MAALLVLDEGTSEYSGWTLDMRDALRGVFPENRRFLQSTAPVGLAISPDGNRVLVRRSAAQSSGADQLSVAQSGGRSEVPVRFPGGSSATSGLTRSRFKLARRCRLGFSSGWLMCGRALRRTHSPYPTPGSRTSTHSPTMAGPGFSLMVEQSRFRLGVTAPRSFNVPDWYLAANGLESSPDGKAIAVVGWNAATSDSTGLKILTLSDAKFLPWATWSSEGAIYRWLPDGSITVANFEAQQAMTLYRVRGPGQVERLGTVPRQLTFSVSFSDDMRRISLVTNEPRGDIWMSTVVR